MSMWTRDRLHSLLTDRLSDYGFICVGNREPSIPPSGIRCTLLVPPEEQAVRMERRRFTVREHSVYRWAAKLLGEAAPVELSGSKIQAAH